MKECDTIINSAIVIGADHYNTLWVIRSLGFCNIKPHVIIYTKSKNSYVSKSRFISYYSVVNDENSLIKVLRQNINKTKQKPYVFISDDIVAETIDKYYNELSEFYNLPNCEQKQGRLGYRMDKWNMYEMAKKAGFTIPWTKKIDLEDKFNLDMEDMHFPCILKPLKSIYGTKYDVRICHNMDDFLAVIKDNKRRCYHYIAQEYIEPDFELTIDGLSNSKDNFTYFSGAIYKDLTCYSTHNLGMVALAHLEKNISQFIKLETLNKFITSINYNGLCSFDLFVKNGITYFLEANLRTDGDMFIYTSAGLNLPQLWIDIQSGKYNKKKEDNIICTCGMIEFSYLKYANWHHPWTIIKDWWKTDCYSIFSWKDMKPFFYKFIYAI